MCSVFILIFVELASVLGSYDGARSDCLVPGWTWLEISHIVRHLIFCSRGMLFFNDSEEHYCLEDIFIESFK